MNLPEWRAGSALFLENCGRTNMSKVSKNTIIGSMAVAGLVAILALLDIFTKSPFNGQPAMDIIFIICAAMMLYMGYDAYKDLK
jgi:zinc transporter ZupT